MANDDQPLTAGEKKLTYSMFSSLRDHCLGDQDEVLMKRCSLTRRGQGLQGGNDLGTLGDIPAEVLLMVVNELDLMSLMSLQACNRRSFNLVHNTPRLSTVAKQAPRVIHAAFKIDMARHIPLRLLYDTMTSSTCKCCGDFGGYLYLLTCQRVCHHCFTRNPDYLPMLRSDACRMYNLAWSELKILPQMRSLPGTYTLVQS